MDKRTQENRLREEWSPKAGELVGVEVIGGIGYGYASELGILRILAAYTGNGSVANTTLKVGFSENLKTHYCSLVLPALPVQAPVEYNPSYHGIG